MKWYQHIGSAASKSVDYVKEIFRDRSGNASSKRWFSLLFTATFLITVNKVFAYLEQCEQNIPLNAVWIIGALLLFQAILILVLMGYSSLAEKIIDKIDTPASPS